MRHHDGSIPVDGNKGPGKRGGHDGRVDEARIGVVAEVERAEVDEVDDEDQLSPVEVGADKEHDKGEVEEVVKNEVASNAGGSIDVVRVAGEEVGNVASLQDEENDPDAWSACLSNGFC